MLIREPKMNQLELPLEEFSILNEIEKKKSWNQSLYVINKSWNNNVYEPKKPNKTYRNKNGEVIGFSISLDQDLKEEYKLYKEYDRNNKKHRLFKDIVINEEILLNRSNREIEILLNNIKSKAKKKNKGVFLYEVEDSLIWNKILYQAIKVFNDYPISVYKL